MKKIILFTAILFTFSMIGCKSGNDPKSVLMSFMDALARKDINGAKKYATKESESMLGFIEMGMKMAPDSVKDKKYDKNNLEYGDAKIEGDKATVPVKSKDSGETTNYTLKKQGADWKVAFDKATMTEMSGDKKKNGGMGSMSDSTGKMMDDLNKMGSDSLHMNPADSMK